MEDFDGLDLQRLMARGLVSEVLELPTATFLDVLDCAARADDTTRNQERAIRAEIDQRRGLE